MEKGKNAGEGRNYRVVYPGRLFRTERLERLKKQGILFCPFCGCELPPDSRGNGAHRCLRCGHALCQPEISVKK